ncbi:hypothetical protein ACU4GD_18585 [Cupriavidus basilensis]
MGIRQRDGGCAGKVSPDQAPAAGETMGEELGRMLSGANQEIILISPYFIWRAAGWHGWRIWSGAA